MSAVIPTAPLRVVQITDCHLGSQPGTRLLNIDTDSSLQAVLGRVRQRHPQPDLLLVTGDISDSGSAAAYQRLHDATRDFPRARWLPGNHDDTATLQQTLAGADCIQREFAAQHWHIIMLDTSVAGEVGGALADTELVALRDCLATLQRDRPTCHALICIHHPVVPVGCAWLDGQRVANADAFWREISAFPQVRAVLCGHVHQPFDQQLQGVRVLTSPSTAWQFAADSADFRVDTLAPGYRWLELHADGRIDTGIERVGAAEFAADVNSAGY